MEDTTQTTPSVSKRSKAINIVVKVCMWIVIVVAIALIVFTVITLTTVNEKDRNIFGYKAFIVLTGSMNATDFNEGDLIFCKEVDPTTLNEGDIITFQSLNEESYGKIITHKIRSLTKDQYGMPGFVTYGTSLDNDDKAIVTYPFVIGKYTGFRIPGMGSFLNFVNSVPGYLVCILLPALLLILSQVYNGVKIFRQMKKEQKAEVQSERDKLQAERDETQKMLDELRALKQQLAEKSQEVNKSETENTNKPSADGK